MNKACGLVVLGGWIWGAGERLLYFAPLKKKKWKKKEPPDSDISVQKRNKGSCRPSAWPHCGVEEEGVGRLTGAESDTNVKQTLISMFV